MVLIKKIAIYGLLLLGLNGCFGQKKKLLYGKWQGVAWFVNGIPTNRPVEGIVFEFKTDDTYYARFGDQEESASFTMMGNMFYTISADGNKMEKMVAFRKITPDTLIIAMNRGGSQPEELVLVKSEKK
jgi:hypothetical protein